MCKQRTCLYLGIDPKRFHTEDVKLIHQPLIQTTPIRELPKEVLEAWPKVTHVLSTSPRAAEHWLSLCETHGKTILAIGEGTAQVWREKRIEPVVAKEATQEGMIELLRTMRPEFALYPKSSKARPLLVQFLKEKRIPHLAFDLYHTTFRMPEMMYPLDQVDQVVFTSPSTVDAFFFLYKTIPSHLEFFPIGPITKLALEKKYSD